MKIAVIGAGISGLTAAYLLCGDNDITVFEANDYAGGHTDTHDVEVEGKTYAVDTGFIVFNEMTYPNFVTLLKRLGVDYQRSSMTFSVKCERTGLEYGPHNLDTFFAQRRNLLKPSLYRMLLDILRFRSAFNGLLREGSNEQALGSYLQRHGYSRQFIDYFIFPLCSSLWSTDSGRIHDFPLRSLVKFLRNHGILEVRHPIEWKVIKGGSKRYVEKLTKPFADRIRLNTPVRTVLRHEDHVEVHPADGIAERFDHVVFGCHSDQALRMLKSATPREREILGAIPYQQNQVVLHMDPSVLPERRKLWSSWNYLIPREEVARVSLTYNMNILQTLDCREVFCVTLNRPDAIMSEKAVGTYLYHHPQYTVEAPRAQRRHGEISGRNRTHYCGAYWGYGFHEDGVNSALAACRFFGKGL
ncbi:MAG TPA: FAD-dependent oxidoreductase [Dissulfurispiraceae bacterium]|nr:FAD-dependent oxidoreductase [Dissulfurispiraceae bacterium]